MLSKEGKLENVFRVVSTGQRGGTARPNDLSSKIKEEKMEMATEGKKKKVNRGRRLRSRGFRRSLWEGGSRARHQAASNDKCRAKLKLKGTQGLPKIVRLRER